MRPDVKLGVIFSMVVVFVAGGYYFYRRNREVPIPVGGDLATTKPASPVKNSETAKSLAGRTAKGPVKSTANRSGPKGLKRLPVSAKKRRGPGNRPSTTANPTNHSPRRAMKNPSPRRRAPVSGARGATVPSTAGINKAKQTKAAAPTSSQPSKGVARNGKTRKPLNPTNTNVTKARPRPNLRQASKPTRATNPRQASPHPTIDMKDAAIETHRVQSGETLASLAKMYYGSERHVTALRKSNPTLRASGALPTGVIVQIPPLSNDQRSLVATRPRARQTNRAKTTSKSQSKPTSRAKRTYTVKPGDSFYAIARDVLGDANRWQELYQLNKALVKGEPTKLKIGQVIRLPAP